MARVVYRDENYQTFYVDVNDQQPEVTIGRNQGNMILIPAKSLSRYHAKIIYQNRRYFLIDLKSSNGSYVNGQRVTNQEIHPGDKIQFGDVGIEFLEDNRGVSAPSAPPAAPMPPQRPAAPPMMGMPKIQMFNPGVAPSAGHDSRSISMRPITSQGNYRPTMPNQPAFDDDMAKLMGNQTASPQPPAAGMPPKPPRPGGGPSLVAPPGPPALDMPHTPAGEHERTGAPAPWMGAPKPNISVPGGMMPNAGGPGVGQMPHMPPFGAPSLNGTPTSGPMGGMPSMPSGMPNVPAGMGGPSNMGTMGGASNMGTTLPAGMGMTMPSGAGMTMPGAGMFSEQAGFHAYADAERHEDTNIAHIDNIESPEPVESTKVAHVDEISRDEMQEADELPSVPDNAVAEDELPSVPDNAVADDELPSVPDNVVAEDELPSVPDNAVAVEEERFFESDDSMAPHKSGDDAEQQPPLEDVSEVSKEAAPECIETRGRMRQRSGGREHGVSGDAYAPATAGVGRRAARTGFFRSVEPSMVPSNTSNVAPAVPSAGMSAPAHARGRGVTPRQRFTNYAHKVQDVPSDVSSGVNHVSSSVSESVSVASQTSASVSQSAASVSQTSASVSQSEDVFEDMGISNPADMLPEFECSCEGSEDNLERVGGAHGEIQDSFEALKEDSLRDDGAEEAELISEPLDVAEDVVEPNDSPIQETQAYDASSSLEDDEQKSTALEQMQIQIHALESELEEVRGKLAKAHDDIENHQKMLGIAQEQNQNDTRLIAELEERIQQMEFGHEEEIANLRGQFDITLEENQQLLRQVQAESEERLKTIDALNTQLEEQIQTSSHTEDTGEFREKWGQRFHALLQYTKAMERAVDKLGLDGVEPKSAEYVRSMTDMIRFCLDELK